VNKALIFGIILLFGITLFGCSVNENEELTESEAIIQVIEKHNVSEDVISDIDFPITMKSGETISKEFKTGGPAPGTILDLELTVKSERNDNKYYVTLSENYNITINGTNAISFWKYEISADGIKLIDKKEDGHLVWTIK